MIIVTFNGESYECDTAIKGDDYIHLLYDGVMVASWDGVNDLSGFSISGGSWTEPTPESSCYLAVIRDDGTIAKGGHRCSDIHKMYHHTITIRDYSNNSFRLSIYNYFDLNINSYDFLLARLPGGGVPALGRFADADLNDHDVAWIDGETVICRDYSTFRLRKEDVYAVSDTVTEII